MSMGKYFLAALLLVSVPQCANAVTLTFDGLATTPDYLSPYDESGYRFTLSGTGATSPHFNDGGFVGQTLQWHEGGTNGSDVLNRLTMIGGGNFDLLQFDIKGLSGSPLQLTLTAPGYAAVVLNSTGANNVINFLNVAWVDFDVTDPGTSTQGAAAIDNVVVNAASAVPLPAALPLLAGGLGLMGFLGRRRKEKAAA